MSDEDDDISEADAMDDWAAAMQEQAEADGLGDDDEADADDEPPKRGRDDIRLEAILDIPVMLSMEIGHTDISIRNLLQLTQGSVVELDRLAGEPMDVLVNGTLIAHGEVVVVNEKFGIRLTDVISPAERVKKLA
ncbi:MAG: flagellar motor switch protein FliN [Chromatiales bacterium]|nr:flagellar motor switch protein FliN [Chromatiales bacterium]